MRTIGEMYPDDPRPIRLVLRRLARRLRRSAAPGAEVRTMSDKWLAWKIFRILMLRGLGRMRDVMPVWIGFILGSSFVVFIIGGDPAQTIVHLLSLIFGVSLIAVGWCGGYTVGWLDRAMEDEP
jgi:hypothetical protein